MNIERAITYLATFVTALIVLAYTFGLQDHLPFFAIAKPTIAAVTIADLPTPLAKKEPVADLQALAQYQATLPTYAVNANQARNPRVEQIADLQALASYQTKLASAWSANQRAQPLGPQITEQIANLQQLAQYQESLAHPVIAQVQQK